MKCPHCLLAYFTNAARTSIDRDVDGLWNLLHEVCPSCGKIIIALEKFVGTYGVAGKTTEEIVYPRSTGRAPCPPEVDDKALSEDYEEACAVLPDSPKASAALSRRCLQHMLQAHAGAKGSNLYQEIEWVIKHSDVPDYLKEELHVVREYGNFAAHPSRDIKTGEIVSVEDGEAEGLLDVIEGLFEHFFVAKKKAEERKAKLEAKKAQIGKGTPNKVSSETPSDDSSSTQAEPTS